MRRKIGLRLVSVIITMLLASLAIYSLGYFSLGDSSSLLFSEDASSKAISNYISDNSRGYLTGYFGYLKAFFSLNWGRTISGQSVKSVILSRLPITLSLAAGSLVLSSALFFSWAVLSEIRKGKTRKGAVLFSLFLMTMPSFMVAILAVILFALLLGIFPVAGYIPLSISFAGHLRSMFLPMLSLALINSPVWLRIYRTELEKIAQNEYSKSIIAQGGNDKDVVLLSALKPSLIFGVSLIADSLVSSLAGSAVIETVFALPGLGSLMVSSALSRDSGTATVLIMLIAVVSSAVYVLSEIIQMAADPRLRREA